MGPPPARITDLPSFDLVFARLKARTSLSSQQELAQALGITPPTVSDAKKRGVFPLEWAYRLARTFDMSLDGLLAPETPSPAQVREPAQPWPEASARLPDIHLVRVALPRVDPDSGLLIDHPEASALPFRRETLARLGVPGMMRLMRVVGRALEPEIRNGDTALVDTSQTRPEPGRYFALASGEALVLRLLEATEAGLAGVGARPDGAPRMRLDASVRVVGRVVWWSREDV